MNLPLDRRSLRPERRLSWLRQIVNAALGKVVTLVLAALALALGVGTFVMLSGGVDLSWRPNLLFAMVLSNLVVLLLLGAVLAGLLVGVVVSMVSLVAPEMAQVSIFALMAVVLLVRPQGFFGRAGLMT